MLLALEAAQSNKVSLWRAYSYKNIYWKPTFICVYTNFDSFLPNTYKIVMIYLLLNRCFCICSNLWVFHSQSLLLKQMFQKYG